MHRLSDEESNHGDAESRRTSAIRFGPNPGQSMCLLEHGAMRLYALAGLPAAPPGPGLEPDEAATGVLVTFAPR